MMVKPNLIKKKGQVYPSTKKKSNYVVQKPTNIINNKNLHKPIAPEQQIVRKESSKTVNNSLKTKEIKPKVYTNSKPKKARQVKQVTVSRRRSKRKQPPNVIMRQGNIPSHPIMGLKGIGRGRILVILACGPSLNEVQVEKLLDRPKIDIMCINKPDERIYPNNRWWAFCDQSQYSRNQHKFETYKGIIINSPAVKARRNVGQIMIRSIGGKGFSRDLTKGFHIGRSTTYANMQTALWIGYDSIYVFGLDMKGMKKDGKLITHYYGDGVNPDVPPDVRVSRFAKEAESYDFGANVLTKEERNRFYICSSMNPWPFVNKYNHLDHEIAVDKILEYEKKI